MASSDISTPPMTLCSAATSCGGVFSKLSGASGISVMLIRHAPLPSPTPPSSPSTSSAHPLLPAATDNGGFPPPAPGPRPPPAPTARARTAVTVRTLALPQQTTPWGQLHQACGQRADRAVDLCAQRVTKRVDMSVGSAPGQAWGPPTGCGRKLLGGLVDD